MKAVAGISPGRGHQVADAHVGRPAIGTDADGEDRNLGLAGRGDGGRGIDAGVLPAVAETTIAGHGRGALVGDQRAQRLAQAGFAALRQQRPRPSRLRARLRFDVLLLVGVVGVGGLGFRRGTGAGSLAERGDAVQIGVEASQRARRASRAACRPACPRRAAPTTCSQAIGRGRHGRGRRRRASPCSGWYRPAPARASCARPCCSVRFSRLQIERQQARQAPPAAAASSTGHAAAQLDRVAAIHPDGKRHDRRADDAPAPGSASARCTSCSRASS